jgi:ABC-2 type transport system ATP-binding protein
MNPKINSAVNPAIQTQSLAKKFGDNEVLRGIDLVVPEGSIYALVGANGAGKTTMIKLLMNILEPSSGSAHVLGWDSHQVAGDAFSRIGYLSENQEIPEWMTVESMLDYMRPFYPQWDRSLERQLVRQFDLPLKRKLKHLSRGMKMKAAFASSLAYRPSLIVLDEPFSGLDPLVRDELIEGLLERAPETTIFLSSHDLAEIESFSSHVGYLQDGRMLFSEEMSTLSDRFRDVTVTLQAPMATPLNLPATWLLAESADHVVHFIHSDYEADVSDRELASAFPVARDITADPMPLRSIFLAIAKSGRAFNRGSESESESPATGERSAKP